MRIRTERSWSRRGQNFWILDYRDGKGYVAKPTHLDFEPVDEGARLPEPTFHVDEHRLPDFIRCLVDLIDEYQFVSKDKLNEKEITAIKYHLEDMRKIAYTLMEKNPGV